MREILYKASFLLCRCPRKNLVHCEFPYKISISSKNLSQTVDLELLTISLYLHLFPIYFMLKENERGECYDL